MSELEAGRVVNWLTYYDDDQQTLLFDTLDLEVKRVVAARYSARAAVSLMGEDGIEGSPEVRISRLRVIRAALGLMGRAAQSNLRWPDRADGIVGWAIDRSNELVGSLAAILPDWYADDYRAMRRILEDPDLPKGHFALEPQELLVPGSSLVSTPLFAGGNHEFMGPTIELWERAAISEHPEIRYWIRVFKGLLAGNFHDWELLSAVLTLDEPEWAKGPEHIARLIEEIEARFALKARIRELEDELSRASKDRLGIGGNDPPEAIEGAPSISKEFTIIWAPLQDLKSEAEKVSPDPKVLLRAVARLRAALVACGIWTARKADASVTAVAVAAATTVGTATGAWMVGHGDKVVWVIEAAETWLATLP